MPLLADSILKNILAYCLKKDDAPMSAQMHLDNAICALSEETDWRPEDPDALHLIAEARESMAMLERVAGQR